MIGQQNKKGGETFDECSGIKHYSPGNIYRQ